MQKKPTYEQLMEELEGIVAKLEEGNIPLADMVALYERGATIGKECMKMLEDYEGKLTVLDGGKEAP